MANWKYISIVVLVLIGGTMYFWYWSLDQFDLAFKDFDVSYSQLSASLAANAKRIASSTVATSTVATTTDISEIATTTPDISIVFPAKGNKVYIGCSYKISWQPLATLRSWDMALIDAGTRKAAGPIASGLPMASSTTGFESLAWKVGDVWPGGYYIVMSKINGVDTDTRSEFFSINKMPKSISASERKNICKESGGSF